MKILAISGSLRRGSSNTTLLEAFKLLAPADVDIILFEGLASLPHFSGARRRRHLAVVRRGGRRAGARGPATRAPEPRRGVRRRLRLAGHAGVAAPDRPGEGGTREVRTRLPAMQQGAVRLPVAAARCAYNPNSLQPEQPTTRTAGRVR